MKLAFNGVLAVAGFASGDRLVAAAWDDTPIGPLEFVLRADASGVRTLLVPDGAARDVVTALYDVDDAIVVTTKVNASDRWIEVSAGAVELQLRAGAGFRWPVRRPPWVTRWIENPVARATLGVQPYARHRDIEGWWRADIYRPVTDGWASIDGRDLGELAPVRPPDCHFGFGEPPRAPAIVSMRALFEDAAGSFDEIVLRAARQRVDAASDG